jgi:hypothetical protein
VSYQGEIHWVLPNIEFIEDAAFYLVKDNGRSQGDLDLRIMKGVVLKNKLHPKWVRKRPIAVAKINEPAWLQKRPENQEISEA